LYKLSDSKAGKLLRNTLCLVIVFGVINVLIPYVNSVVAPGTGMVVILDSSLEISKIFNAYIAPVLLILAVGMYIKTEKEKRDERDE
jgi:hypothetical protein